MKTINSDNTTGAPTAWVLTRESDPTYPRACPRALWVERSPRVPAIPQVAVEAEPRAWLWFDKDGLEHFVLGKHQPLAGVDLEPLYSAPLALEPVAVEAEPVAIRTELSDETKAQLKELSDASRAGAVSLARNPMIVGATTPLALEPEGSK